MNGEEVPVQIRIWFRDGGYYDLRGTLDEIKTDRQLGQPVDGGIIRWVPTEKLQWFLRGTMKPWEFDRNERPDLLNAPVARVVPAKHAGPDRSERARRRARSRVRKRAAA